MNAYRVTWRTRDGAWVETVHAPNRRAALWQAISTLRDLFARPGVEISPRTVTVRRLEEPARDA